MMRASPSSSTNVPRALRMNFGVRLIMPWRLPAWAAMTLPVPVILKRFFTPLFVFILGILLPFAFSLLANGSIVRLKLAALLSAFLGEALKLPRHALMRRAALRRHNKRCSQNTQLFRLIKPSFSAFAENAAVKSSHGIKQKPMSGASPAL